MTYQEKVEFWKEFVLKEWNSLCKEYNLNGVGFTICHSIYYVGQLYMRQYPYEIKFLSEEELIDSLNFLIDYTDGQLMVATQDIIYDGSGLVSKTDGLVLMDTHDLYNILINMNFNKHRLKRFFKNALRHEMGHMLDFQKKIIVGKTTASEVKKMNILERRARKRYRKWLDDNPDRSKEKHAKRYFSIKSEREANKLVGLTWKDFV